MVEEEDRWLWSALCWIVACEGLYSFNIIDARGECLSLSQIVKDKKQALPCMLQPVI